MYKLVLVGSAKLSIFALNDASSPASPLLSCSHPARDDADSGGVWSSWIFACEYAVPGILWTCYMRIYT